ncbi:unnamed protein product, partial [Owenia fusiformis]
PTVLSISAQHNSPGAVPNNCYGTLLTRTVILVPATCVYDRKLGKPYRMIKVNTQSIGKTRSAVHVSPTWLKKGHTSYNLALVIIPTQRSTPTTKLKWNPYTIEQLQVNLKTPTKKFTGCVSLKKLGTALDENKDHFIPFKCTNLATPESKGGPIYQTNKGVDEVFGLYNGACTIGWGLRSKKGHCGVRVTERTYKELCVVAKTKGQTINGCEDVLLNEGSGDTTPTIITTAAGYTAVVNTPKSEYGILLQVCPAKGCCGSRIEQLQRLPNVFRDTVVRQINMVKFKLDVTETPAMFYRPKEKDSYLQYEGTHGDFEEWKNQISKEIAAGKIRRGIGIEEEGIAHRVKKRGRISIIQGRTIAHTCLGSKQSQDVPESNSVPSYCKYEIWRPEFRREEPYLIDLDIRQMKGYCTFMCHPRLIDNGACFVTVDIADYTKADECIDYLDDYGLCQGKPDCKTRKRPRDKRFVDDHNWKNCKGSFIGGKAPQFKPAMADKNICQDHNTGNRFYYATLYSTSQKIPAWSAYKVEDLCTSKDRSSSWRKEKELDCNDQASNDDYKSSGYHKGHLNPNAIHNCDVKVMKSTFTLTNAAPQRPTFNSGRWNAHEGKTRKYLKEECVKNSGHLYLITGTQEPFSGTIGAGKVGIPKYFWTAGCCIHKTTGNYIGSFAYRSENKDIDVVVDMGVKTLEGHLKMGSKELFPGNIKCSKKSSDLK